MYTKQVIRKLLHADLELTTQRLEQVVLECQDTLTTWSPYMLRSRFKNAKLLQTCFQAFIFNICIKLLDTENFIYPAGILKYKYIYTQFVVASQRTIGVVVE